MLLLGELDYHSPRVSIPHEQVTSRRFVLIPLLELDMRLATPAGAELAAALAVLPVGEGVRRAGRPLSLQKLQKS